MTTHPSPTDRIERSIDLNAPVSRVWKALTDHVQFGEWFRVRLEGPFVVGKPTFGQVLSKGYEHLRMELVTQRLEPEQRFSYTWHPYAVDPKVDYSKEPPTLVEFFLEPVPAGTRVRVVESGFDRIPPHRRDEAFRMNGQGWSIQMKNIEAYVARPR